jgi:hypothetical protein
MNLAEKSMGRAFVLVALATVSGVAWAQEPPLGVVQQASHAHVKQGEVTEGATVYAGEELGTDVGGVLALSVGGAGFTLLESSRAFFYSSAAGPIAELRNGAATFRKEAGGATIAIVASDVRITSKGDGPVTGQVMIVSPCEVRVTTVVGQVEVTSGSETHLIGERETYSVTPEVSVSDPRGNLSPDDPGYHESHAHKSCTAERGARRGAPPVGAGSSHFLKIAAIAGAAAAAAAVLLLSPKSSSESPSRP